MIDEYSYEKRYMEEEEENKKSAENVKEGAAVGSPAPAPAAETISKTEASGEKSENQKTKTASTKTSEQDLDVFLLGDLGDSDEGPGMLSRRFLLYASELVLSSLE